MTKDFALLLLRILGALMAVNHGWGKVWNLGTGEGDRFIAGVATIGFPMPVVFAWIAALSEFLGGILVAIGLFTRPAAFFSAGTMLVAGFLRHRAHLHLLAAVGIRPVAEEQLEKWGNPESAVVYLLGFLAILLLGPGAFSVDQLLAGKVRKKSPARGG